MGLAGGNFGNAQREDVFFWEVFPYFAKENKSEPRVSKGGSRSTAANVVENWTKRRIPTYLI